MTATVLRFVYLTNQGSPSLSNQGELVSLTTATLKAPQAVRGGVQDEAPAAPAAPAVPAVPADPSQKAQPTEDAKERAVFLKEDWLATMSIRDEMRCYFFIYLAWTTSSIWTRIPVFHAFFDSLKGSLYSLFDYLGLP